MDCARGGSAATALHDRPEEVPMIARALRLAAVLAAAILVAPAASAEDKDKLKLDEIPKKVMDVLKARFPKAEIHKWTKEKEGADVVYDIEFKENGCKCEADIKEDGTYINFEREVAARDLPKAVVDAVEKKYPKATMKEV